MNIVTRHIPFKEIPEMARLDELRMGLNSGSRTGDDSCDVVRLKGDKPSANW